MNYIEVLEITKDNLQEAQFMSSNYIDKTVSNRIFFNVVAAEAFGSYLKNFGVDIDNLANIHSIKRVVDKVDIADIILPNIHIDVRVIFQDDVIFIPKSHFSYGIVPDIYVVLKYDRNFQRINLLGFFEPSVIKLSNSNDEYYFLEPEKLQSPIDIIDFILNFNGNTQKPVTEEQVDRVKELSVAVADHDVTQEEFKEFLHLMSMNSDLRDIVIEYDNFETLSYGVTSAINRFAALKASQNDVIDINDFMGFEGLDNESESTTESDVEGSTNFIGQSSDQVEDANGDSMLDEVEEVEESIASTVSSIEEGPGIESVIASNEAVELAAVAGDIANNLDINPDGTSEDISEMPNDNFAEDELFEDDIEDDIEDENISANVENIDSKPHETILAEQSESNESSEESLSDMETDFSDFGDELSEQVLDDFNNEDETKEDDSYIPEDLVLSDLPFDTENFEDEVSNEQEAEETLKDISDNDDLDIESLSDVSGIEESALEESLTPQEVSEEDNKDESFIAEAQEDEFSDSAEDTSADFPDADELSLDFDENNLDFDQENSPENSLKQEDETTEKSLNIDSMDIENLNTNTINDEVIEDYELPDTSFDIDDSIITSDSDLKNISDDIDSSLNIEGDISVLPSEDASDGIELKADEIEIDDSDIESAEGPQSFEDLTDNNEDIEALNDEKEEVSESLGIDDEVSNDILPTSENDEPEDKVSSETDNTALSYEEKDGENDDTFELDLNEFVEDKNDSDNAVGPEKDEYQIDISALPLEDVPSAPDEEIHTVDPSDIFEVENSVETKNDIDTSYNQELPIDADGVQNSETLESNDTDNAHDLDNLPLAELEEQPGDSEDSLVSFSDITDTPTVEPYNAEVSFETMDDFSDFETLIPSEDNSNSDVDYNDEDSESQAEFFSTPVISENSVVISDKNHTPGEIFIDINKDSSNPDVPVENEHLEELYNNENSSAENIGLNNEVRVTKGSSNSLPIFVGVGGIALVLLLVGIIFFSVSKYINPATKDNEPIVAEGNPVQSNLGTDVPNTSNVNNNVVMNNNPSGTVRPKSSQNQDVAQTPSQPTKPIPATAFLSVRKLSWEVPDYVSYDANFKQYFQSSGKSLKAALNSDLLLATDYTYSDQIRVSILFSKDGTFKQAKILLSSGSSQVDNIVLQSVNQTLRVLKAPNSLGNDESTTVILKIYI